MDVRRTHRILKYRNHNSVVERMTKVNTSAAVTPVDPITPITNNPSLISYNSLLASDEFYDKLSRLQREYKRFYHDQQQLERALNDMSENSDSLIDNMNELVEKYNLAYNSLKKFDLHFNTNNKEAIERILAEFRENLLEVGVHVLDSGVLTFDNYEFKRALIDSNDAIKFLFRPIKGLIIKLHKAFKNITIPQDENVYYEHESLDYNGMITDEKI